MVVRLSNRDLKKLSPKVRKEMGAKVQKFNNNRSKEYDSDKEANYAAELRLWVRCGHIYELREQVPFEIVGSRGGSRPRVYIADFVYRDKDGKQHVVDVKGMQTAEFKLKKALMWERHGIRIEIV
jgi:hypothetical protein